MKAKILTMLLKMASLDTANLRREERERTKKSSKTKFSRKFTNASH